MVTIKQEAGKTVEMVKEFAAAHPRATVTGAAIVGGTVAVAVATTKIGMTILVVTGVLAAAGFGVGIGRVLGEALVRQSAEYMPPVVADTPTA